MRTANTDHTMPRSLPPPVAAVLSRLPPFPGSLLLVTGLNLALARQLPEDVRQRLRGQRVRIHVRDASLRFDFVWQGRHFQACQPHAEPHLTISASAHDFVRLAQRQEDPDTLFFNRRLSMEGDTELGLLVKNALDAMELPVVNLASLAPTAVLARVRRTCRPIRPTP